MQNCRGKITEELVQEMRRSQERKLVQRLKLLKEKSTEELMELQRRIRVDTRAAMEVNMNSSDFDYVFGIIDRTEVKLEKFTTNAMHENIELLGAMVSFLRCRVLFDIFLLVYFAPKTVEEAPASLKNYYNCAATQEGFVYELHYLYLCHVDATFNSEVEMARREGILFEARVYQELEARGYGETATTNALLKRRSGQENNGMLKIFCGSGMCIESVMRCPFLTEKSAQRLLILFSMMPYILKNWTKTRIGLFCQPYRRILRVDSRLRPSTIVGLYVHFVMMTPTHLSMCVEDVLRASSNEWPDDK